MTTQEKVDLICSDFLHRNGENFTHARQDGRLGWEKSLKEGEAYSSALNFSISDENLLKDAYKHACDMITAMNIPTKVNIVVGGESSFSNGESIQVATDMFDDEAIDRGARTDIFTGLAIHEGSHILYSDMDEFLKAKNHIISNLTNLIEDERIEMRLGDNRPGLVNFVARTKYYYFSKHSSRMQASNQPMDKLARLFSAILSMVRYPESLDTNDVEEFADTLLKVREAMLPFPKSTREARTLAERLYNLLKDFLKEEKKQDKKQEQEQKGNGSNGKGEGSSSEGDSENSEGSEGGSEDSEEGENSSEGGEGTSEPKSENSQDNSSNNEPKKSKKSNRKEKEKESTEGESEPDDEELDAEIQNKLKAIVESLEQDAVEDQTGGANSINSDRRRSELIDKNYSRLARILQGEICEGVTNKVDIIFPKDNKVEYQESLQRVRAYIPALSNILRMNGQDQVFALKGMRSGRLDVTKLAEAVQGVENVYNRETIVKADRMAVCVLIDESGSMSGCKIQTARDTAVLLTEALSRVPNIDLYIYGHSTTYFEDGQHVFLNVFREQGARCNRYALGSIEDYNSNIDSKAIKECAVRVRRHTREKCLFFVISDGQPCEPEENVKKVVREITKDGFSVVSIGIAFLGLSHLYENHVPLLNLKRFAPELGKIIRKAILNNTNKKIL